MKKDSSKTVTVKARVVLDDVSRAHSKVLTTKTINKAVKSDMKILKKHGFG